MTPIVVQFYWDDGDVNADLTVDVADLQSVVYYAMNYSKLSGKAFNYTAANANAARNRMGSRNIRIGAIVDVKHRSLRTLEQDLAALFDFLIEQGNRVADIRTQTVSIAVVFLEDLLIVEGLMVIEQL